MKILITALLLLIFSIDTYASCESKFFSFKVKNTKSTAGTVLNVLEHLIDECKLNLLFTDEKSRKIVDKKIQYLNVNDASFDELMDLLLTHNNLFYSLSPISNTLKVSYLKTKSFHLDYVSFIKSANSTKDEIQTGTSGDSGGSTTLDFQTEFKLWDVIKDEITSIVNRGGDKYKSSDIIVNQEAGIITVTGTKKQIDRVEKYIKDISKRLQQQILIDAKVIEVTYGDNKITGIDWSKFQATIDGNTKATTTKHFNPLEHPSYLIGYDFSIAGLLSFLKTQGDVSIVSNPKILTLNNQPAIINVGEEKNYKFTTGSTSTTTNGVVQTEPQYEIGSTFVGVTLGVVPQVTEDNFIILKINPIISEISERHLDEKGVPSLAPDIKIKQLSSIVKVKNNKKILLGGLIQKRVEDKTTSIPILGDIPLLGRLFKSKRKVNSKSELIIVMTPRLVSGDEGMSTLDELENKGI